PPARLWGAPSGGRAGWRARRLGGGSSAAQHLRDQERQCQALLGVEPRVARRLVAATQVRIRNILGATEALGDVLAGELQVDAAGMSAQRVMHLEEPLHLVDDPVEVPGLVTG